MQNNNYYCSESNCDYKTDVNSSEEADKHLIQDGGYDSNKKTMCPKCKKDSLVFITAV